MELRRLRYFVAVAEELNFRKAAERLQIAQPPLSQQIIRLERELGTKLLERGPRRVELTPAGRALLAEAHALLSRAEQARRITRRAADGATGAIRIGCIGSACAGWLPRLLPHYREHRPDVLPLVYEQQTGAQLESLRRGEIDVGILRTRGEQAGLTCHPLGAEPMVVVLPRDHPLAAKRVVPLAALAGEPFVYFPRRIAPDQFDTVVAACADSGFGPDIVHEAYDDHTSISLVASGLGVSLVPATSAELRMRAIAYRRLRPEVRAAPMVAAVPDTDPHPQAAGVVRAAQHVARDLT